jgi:hypothetical protein
LNEFLWTTVLEQRQRDRLNAIGIHDSMSILISQCKCTSSILFSVDQLRDREREHDARAQQAYRTIPKLYKDILWTMGTHRHAIYPQRSMIAHPRVTRNDFFAYIQASFPDNEAELRPIGSVQLRKGGYVEDLFIDDTDTAT